MTQTSFVSQALEIRKQKDELSRQKLYETLRKNQEREQEKQKQKLVKEQVSLHSIS